jgi:hypothetical protein
MNEILKFIGSWGFALFVFAPFILRAIALHSLGREVDKNEKFETQGSLKMQRSGTRLLASAVKSQQGICGSESSLPVQAGFAKKEAATEVAF